MESEQAQVGKSHPSTHQHQVLVFLQGSAHKQSKDANHPLPCAQTWWKRGIYSIRSTWTSLLCQEGNEESSKHLSDITEEAEMRKKTHIFNPLFKDFILIPARPNSEVPAGLALFTPWVWETGKVKLSEKAPSNMKRYFLYSRLSLKLHNPCSPSLGSLYPLNSCDYLGKAKH